jgi:hypothetical protein
MNMQIIFSKKLYSTKSVNQAIKQYAELAVFSVSEKKKEIVVTLKNIDSDVKNVIRDEFCNYVLYLMKK